MRHVIAPYTAGTPTADSKIMPAALSLGGVFYDYLCRPNGAVCGVRYYLMDTVNFKQHPVFRQFLNDRRFSFRPDNYIDMVFEERDADALQLGRFKVSVVQDFGGESVVKCGDKFGIIFDLPA